FQAEDGIRDRNVTGVQTCALPIYYHPDHVRVGELVANCAWFATSPGHDTGQPPLDALPAVVYMDNVAGINFEPTHLVDISATIEIGRASCRERGDLPDDGVGVHRK